VGAKVGYLLEARQSVVKRVKPVVVTHFFHGLF